MFLTRGEIHQEPLWKLWFQHLAGMVPVSALRVSPYLLEPELALEGRAMPNTGAHECSTVSLSRQHVTSAQLIWRSQVQHLVFLKKLTDCADT